MCRETRQAWERGARTGSGAAQRQASSARAEGSGDGLAQAREAREQAVQAGEAREQAVQAGRAKSVPFSYEVDIDYDSSGVPKDLRIK
ncbi:hypothetical protein E2562_020182 [Oryza meyeriana var. granulata]|uniref:Uncharacterized protein n=1 Tax=Oryza meyeriana var. granulata TaxID=110450 RepID=A0A6G1BMH3_9ORYZ|nr:hypothetical protein E2562_020182 [Oryza meyeriana var. granulata]